MQFLSQSTCDNLVFSSVGDNSNIKCILGPGMNYDVYFVYYGERELQGSELPFASTYVKGIYHRKGSKFQNFKHFYDTYPDIIGKYQRFFILDDDIIADIASINQMFDTCIRYKLKICSPAFGPGSKISHPITVYRPGVILAYTNFVEVTYVMLTAEALARFMPYLDESLIGWGIDYLYIWCNGLEDQHSYAIVHSVQCINPSTRPNGKRELELIRNCRNRRQIWERYARKIGCPASFKHVEYRSDLLND